MSEGLQFNRDSEQPERLVASGDWRLDHASNLERIVAGVSGEARVVDASGIEYLDAAGAFLLLRAARRLSLEPGDIELRDEHRPLFDVIVSALEGEGERETEPPPLWREWLGGIGLVVTGAGGNFRLLVGFLGLALSRWATTLFRPSQWRVTATVFHMQQTGLNALPLTALLAFLVGAVVAYLGATVLRDFGAELFVVDLITYAFLREFGVLLTAILLAGRTASAFTAQIGTMKSREEIDAMRTLGLDPVVLLVLPRLLALLVMLPILALLATVAGFLGGLAVSVLALGIEPNMFLTRMQEAVTLQHYLVGLVKAPLFAATIALIGCLEGFKVAGTAQSVGEHTTSAVVQSITLVIVIDALAAIFFMEMGW
ncbi:MULTISPECIES: MlaE family lipid ABC transporter permease subunit [unclassified Wenzhouxiangella]|uniref:ABC transporter permease n=1 Tax=unclassified Wenzhouxiangella TaxID=2613841 RepID=UPI000E32CF47|nr:MULTISPECIES: MlaE family lipid ABC transporter permease subunit [unclassified Wenzhouxiangella]RFF28414.1 MlaE family lipid ABC transporter permease subunit [Wenzhouxiangella sp. 15181]RFP69931.1 MlaE family lipid ABC transporter permease subunit [Wenzhouxiangella sp. 15190]